MRGEKPIRILIADDHPVVRMGLAALIGLRPDMEVVAQAENGREAVELFRRYHPDVTLMDLVMPEIDGTEAIKAIRAESPSARILVLTTYQTEEDIFRSLQAGARGYLLKAAPGRELVEAIRAVYAGQKRIPADVAAKLAERLPARELTARELEVLHQMAQGKSNEEIGAALHISEGTVKTHVTNILSKLAVNDRTQAVIAAVKRGLVRV
ncbi:MAG TPA: response regulator transcription factor [Chthonomonadaceae bacterium]|nr:response regulator transcription factor [Chthonomonadaceae bacterium]